MSTNDTSGDESFECPTCERSFTTDRGVKSHHAKAHGESIAGISVECDYCGLEIQKTNYEVERNEHFFCDGECQSDWYKERRPEVECENCGDLTLIHQCELEQQDHYFCNEECYLEWNAAEIVSVECTQCGTPLERVRRRLERTENQFCDSECRAEWVGEYLSREDNPQRNRRTVDCGQCGSKITRPKSLIEEGDNNFCDQECLGQWMKENLRGKNHPHWRGGRVDYGEGWSEHKREKVRERDGRTCQSCGMTGQEHRDQHNGRLHVHHIQKARTFDDPEKRNAMENLISLCISCHNTWEEMSPLRPEIAELTN